MFESLVLGEFNLILILLAVVSRVVPILAADRQARLSRLQYLLRLVFAFVGVGLAMGAVAAIFGNQGLGYSRGFDTGTMDMFTMFFLGISLWFAFMTSVWSVHRCQDIGWNKWLCLILLAPYFGYVFFLVLLFVPSKAPGPDLKPKDAAVFD